MIFSLGNCLLYLVLLLGGCMVGPNYHAPENQVAAEWASNSIASEVISQEAPLIAWWTVFNEPLLDQYIEKAAKNNYDIRTAEANILQARAMRQIAASSFFPQIGADVNATRTYFSKNGPIFAIGPSTGTVPGTISPSTGLPFSAQVPQTQNLYNALFDATWEIDLFGKTRRSVQAAEANIGSSIEQRNDTLITILAEIARNYMDIRSNQELSKLVEENIAFLEQEAAIIEKQFESGYVSRLDLENIQAELSTQRAKLPDLKSQIYRGIYTISILTGDVPETLVDELIQPRPLPNVPNKVSMGVRSDLLRRRPDIRRSERQLASATANVGVAVASFFPTFTLFGDGGFQSLMVKNLFTAASRTWAFGGDVTLPIFEGGQLVGNLNANRAVASAAACAYQQIVLNALEETESALVAYVEDFATTNQLKKATQSDENLVELTRERYSKGLVNLLHLVDSERQLNAAQQSLLQSEAKSLFDLIVLYKALGGGWEEEENQEIK